MAHADPIKLPVMPATKKDLVVRPPFLLSLAGNWRRHVSHRNPQNRSSACLFAHAPNRSALAMPLCPNPSLQDTASTRAEEHLDGGLEDTRLAPPPHRHRRPEEAMHQRPQEARARAGAAPPLHEGARRPLGAQARSPPAAAVARSEDNQSWQPLALENPVFEEYYNVRLLTSTIGDAQRPVLIFFGAIRSESD